MIEISHINKTFNRGQVNEVIALNDVSLSMPKGEFAVVIGANGSGKTTLLNILAGSVLPSAGRILIDGDEVTLLPEYRRCRWVARVFQDPLGGTAPELSILDNFRLAALRTRSKGLRIGVDGAFKQQVRGLISILGLGLENKIQQPIGSLSGGQRQALTLLMSTLDHTDILLLDEPTAALDPKSAEVVMETAQRLIREQGLTALLITHNLREAHRYGERLIQMSGGSIVRDLGAGEKAGLQMETMFGWFV